VRLTGQAIVWLATAMVALDRVSGVLITQIGPKHWAPYVVTRRKRRAWISQLAR
jgi:hypothetical protein